MTDTFENRPTCSVPGCNKQAAHQVGKTHPSYPYWRRCNWILEEYPEADGNFACGHHQAMGVAKNRGLPTAQHVIAENKGMTITEYRHSIHPYLSNRKSYCENIDGRLGFKCTTNIFWEGMLDVDHIDGDHTNNDTKNLQTLCKCCHAYKGWKNKDYKTPGRKTRKITRIT